ncbi:MAG TPA: S8 family serine peptidase [Candidatus Aquilonibacter sp.]|nr:S8 family serine peptidase [Candidatus Aquilonibacter sp.]
MNINFVSRRETLSWSRYIAVVLLLFVMAAGATQAQAQTRLVVRDSLGLRGLNLTCLLTGCQVVRGLGDPQGQLFLVTFPPILNPVTSILKLSLQLGIVDIEIDQTVNSTDPNAGAVPSYLTDETPTAYYGATVWQGYLTQPGNQLVETSKAQSSFRVTGSGATVAIIDTGVDPNHPVLKGVLVNGYDFTRNVAGGSEDADVNASPDPSDAQTADVNQRTVAVLDQRTVAVLDGGDYDAFGHGTMTAGIVHLVAPQAKIMPLKAFQASGAGYESDILRAIYYAVQNGANVMSMSWDFPTYSGELASAVKYARGKGVVAVASAGNDGEYEFVYPGALPGVINVASTSNQDVQSTFTNYGTPPVFMAAPGEGIMTLYPWGTYAAGWGTSFSTPFVAGTAALMLGKNGGCNSANVASGLTHADVIFNPQLGWGRLDAYSALTACHGLL